MMWKGLISFGLVLAVLAEIHHISTDATVRPLETQFDPTLQNAIATAQSLLQTAVQEAQQQLQQAGIPVPSVTVSQSQDGTQIIEVRIDRRWGIHRLPAVPPQAEQSAGPVKVQAGDRGVSAATLQRAVTTIQQVSLPVLSSNLNARLGTATVVLFSTPSAYANALRQAGLPASEISQIVRKTGGLTVGTEVWVPLYALQGHAELANVVTHELTHVWLNQQGLGDKLPTWINEGIAWYSGMTAEAQVSRVEAEALAQAYDGQLRAAAANGQLLPLSASESDILKANYNVEWEDYRAVQALVQAHGNAALRSFLSASRNEAVSTAFAQAFGISESTFEQQFLQSLERGF